ncbi:MULTISPECIES: DUF5941 domain-containing protein [Thermomonosporaceae]|uniref:DUF5941 domain-containing protein n=1 Tax=Thermomonosporaceae TaxID=2012 RepID=UPI00255AFEF7|nr:MULTISPECIES: DUF5941 domain-containing protein [Thermomonosporaceae]MDL4776074.1 DUF5941 domain-containing protein [Actinomadura xylanilytica]
MTSLTREPAPRPSAPSRPARPRPAPLAPPERLQIYRDDGPICRALGRLARGQLPPLPGATIALVVTVVLLSAGVGDVRGPALFAPVVVLLLTGPASTHPHDGRMDCLVPPIIRGIEYGCLTVLGFAQGVSAPLVYVLVAVLAFHHYDTVYRTRQGLRPPEWIFRAGLGWEGRMLIVAFTGLSGLLPFAYAALAVYLGVLFAGESVMTWARTGRDSGVMVDLEEVEA